MSVELTYAQAVAMFKENVGKTMTVGFKPGAIGAKGDITLPIPLDLHLNHSPIESILHVNGVGGSWLGYAHTLIGSGAVSQQTIYDGITTPDVAGEFEIKDKDTIICEEAMIATSILLIKARWL